MQRPRQCSTSAHPKKNNTNTSSMSLWIARENKEVKEKWQKSKPQPSLSTNVGFLEFFILLLQLFDNFILDINNGCAMFTFCIGQSLQQSCHSFCSKTNNRWSLLLFFYQRSLPWDVTVSSSAPTLSPAPMLWFKKSHPFGPVVTWSCSPPPLLPYCVV